MITVPAVALLWGSLEVQGTSASLGKEHGVCRSLELLEMVDDVWGMTSRSRELRRQQLGEAMKEQVVGGGWRALGTD